MSKVRALGILFCWALLGLFINASGAEFSFPLKVSQNGRFLVDQRDHPFLVVGDTAWSLIAQLNAQGVKQYLDDRQTKGFNSILVNLIEHKFCSQAPLNHAGQHPFLAPGDFNQPNEAYFSYAESVVAEANKRGLVVWLVPAYLGYNGGDEGWFREIKSSGPKALREYGRYVGDRFKKFPNLIWVMGGDFTPPAGDLWTINDLAAGIRDSVQNQLITVHGAPGKSAAGSFPDCAWLNLNMAYSYDKDLYRPLLDEYRRRPVLPFVLLEATYENEHNATPDEIRRQAYWTMLCGGCGQFLGNNPIWHFDGPGLYKFPGTWQEALHSQGSLDMVRLRKVFGERRWFALQPDVDQRIIADGSGQGTARVTTAAAPDGDLAMCYFPSHGTEAREVTVDLARFSGPVVAQWYNPTTGIYTRVTDATLPNRGKHSFKTPGDNGSQANDWLLILETAVKPALVAAPAA